MTPTTKSKAPSKKATTTKASRSQPQQHVEQSKGSYQKMQDQDSMR